MSAQPELDPEIFLRRAQELAGPALQDSTEPPLLEMMIHAVDEVRNETDPVALLESRVEELADSMRDYCAQHSLRSLDAIAFADWRTRICPLWPFCE